jgi:hypothetical protein
MEKITINFRCPAEVVATIDAEAAADHRDRTSLLNKIIAFYYKHNPPKGAPKKKTGRKA